MAIKSALGRRGRARNAPSRTGGNSGRSRSASAMPGGLERGSSPTVMADRSEAVTPRRSRAPTSEPAEVPTTTSADRGSQARSCSIAANAAAW